LSDQQHQRPKPSSIKNFNNIKFMGKLMSHFYKTLAMLVTVGCLVTLSGCIIDPNQNPAGSNYQPNPGGKAYGASSGSPEWNRGCSDAKSGSYDRSGNAGQAYEDGWNACRSGGNQSGAQQQGGVEAAKQACTFQFGQSGYVQTVTPLKPGFWEIIVTDNSGRKVACTADAQGKVLDWVQM
jgi:hypothetical protein